MKIAVVVVLCCALQGAVGQFSLWNRPGFTGQFGTRYPPVTFPHFTNPPPTTTTSTTTRTTTRRTNAPCVYKAWGKCSAGMDSYRTRQPLDHLTHCTPQRAACEEGAKMAANFLASFSTPGTPTGASITTSAIDPDARGIALLGSSTLALLGSSGRGNRTGSTSTTTAKTVNFQRVLSRVTPIRQCGGDANMGNCNPQGRAKRQAPNFPIIQTKRDVLLLLDESGSVGITRYYTKVKRIAAAIVEVLCQDIAVAPDKTRIAVTSFDSRTHDHVRLNQFFPTQVALGGYIRSNTVGYNYWTSHRTCLVDALIHAYEVMSSTTNGGRRFQPNVEQDIILITDGCANCHTYGVSVEQVLQNLADFFVQEGVHIYVIGVGLNHACRNKLRILAQGGRCFHFFFLNSWDYDVNNFIQQLEFPPANSCLALFESPTQQCLPSGR